MLIRTSVPPPKDLIPVVVPRRRGAEPRPLSAAIPVAPSPTALRPRRDEDLPPPSRLSLGSLALHCPLSLEPPSLL